MPIAINGSGTITGLSTGGLPDGSVDTDTLADAAVTAAKRGTGAILQVVQGYTSTEVEVTTTTFTDTGLTATITPTSTTSKILVLVNQQVYWVKDTVGQGVGIKILRGSTEIYSAPVDGSGPFDSYSGYITNLYTRVNVHVYDDDHGSSSDLIYKVQGRPYYSSNNGKAEFNTAATTNATSFITLIEVA